jgi:hypothetical protein
MQKPVRTVDGLDTRRNMLRVWLAISAVWVAFWMVIAAIALASVQSGYLFAEELQAFATIVILPPLTLLCFGLLAFTALSLFVRADPRRTVR